MKTSTTGNEADLEAVKTEPGMPKKLVAWRQKLSDKAKQEKEFRFYSLYSLVCHPDTLGWAWKLVRRNDGAPGVDGVDFERIEQSEGGVERFLLELERKLKEKRYKAKPVRRVYIEKPNGGLRPLGIPTIEDRVVQMAVKLIIEPIFEADFNDCSYGYRPERSAQDALKAIRGHLEDGMKEVYDADLSGYFDTIPHDKLMLAVRKRIVDGSVLKLIRQWLKAPVLEPKDKRGGPPKVERKGKGRPFRYLNIFPSSKSLKRERLELRRRTNKRQCFKPLPVLIDELNRHLKGWANYYSYGYPRKAFRDINHYVGCRLSIHLKRRSQRAYKVPEGKSVYRHLQELGLRHL